jgi:TRAP-type C4-dicarboxylate transport system permease small subunit
LQVKSLGTVIGKLIDYFIFVVFTAMVVVTFLQVVLRYGFSSSLPGAGEVARFSMIWLTFVAAAVAIRERAHPRVDYFIRWFLGSLYRLINVLINVVLGLFVVVLSYYSLNVVETSMANRTPGLGLPLGYVNLALPVGGLLMILYLITDSIRWLRADGENGADQ